MRPINSIKSAMKLMNSNKNKLNSKKKNWLFKLMANTTSAKSFQFQLNKLFPNEQLMLVVDPSIKILRIAP